MNDRPFFGTAIGGSLGATRSDMHSIVSYTRSRVRDDRPVHLLGIGGVRDIFHGVRCGIDTFDCVHPTRLARHGGALVDASYWDLDLHPIPPTTVMTSRSSKKLRDTPRVVREHVDVSKARMRNDPRPIDPACQCYTCSKFSRAYLHHLFKAKESLGGTLVTIHNIHFMNRLMRDIR